MDKLSLVYWHWFALGSFLLIIELLAPGMFFLWLAFAAFVTGGLLWGIPDLSLELQWIAFAIVAVSSVGGLRQFLVKHPISTDQPLLNKRALQLCGRVFRVEDGIVNGEGRIRVDDSLWRVRGEDCSKGTKVRVISADGVVLRVEKVEEREGLGT